MAEDGVPTLDVIRRSQEHLTTELQEHKDKLDLLQDDPDYSNLDGRELEDLEAELGDLHKMGYQQKTRLYQEEDDGDLKTEDTRRWKRIQAMISSCKVVCRRLQAIREVFGKIQTADKVLAQLKDKRLEYPTRDYSTSVKRVADKVNDVLEILEDSSVPLEHKLRTRAMELEISLEDMEIVDKLLTEARGGDRKDKPEPPKMQPIAPPTFSGKQKDWQSFWTSFQDIHKCGKYSDAAKLSYLRQAQKDVPLYNQLCQNVANGDNYDKVVADLLDQYDRPRENHRIYVDNVARMQSVKATRSSLMACATTLQSSIDGLTRLKQLDAHTIFTTLVEPLLPEKIKTQWEEATVDKKTVPPVEELIAFLRKRASMPQYADKPQENPYAAERKPFKQQGKHKGSVHVASTAPAPQQPQHSGPRMSPSAAETRPTASNRASPVKVKPNSLPFCRYNCPLCNQAHYAWGCPAFKSKTVPQRLEHVKRHNLCSNCLKPGHLPADCRSKYTCQTCNEKHNSLIHSGPESHSTQASVHHITDNCSSSSLNKAKLLMTCEILVTGPTGKSMPVRALLDSGADISSITNKVARHLKLKTLRDTVAVATFGSSTETICGATTFTLSSLVKKDWSHQVSAVMVDRITGEHPRQDASVVKTMPAIKDLIPADPLFHKPGRIDVLLGADVLPYVQSPSEAPSSIIAVDTVFGHAFMGTYQPAPTTSTVKASIQLATEIAQPTLKHLIHQVAKFWEAESPLLTAPPHTDDELRILQEYDLNHKFISSIGKYQVKLPRREQKRQLGESRSVSLQRFYQNEIAQEKKGTIKQYQAVMQEYLDLDHARLCTDKELQLPASVSYHLPMHGVAKTSSTTTKLRIVFDASAKTSSGWSLNDSLAAGPVLYPKLAEVLIRFRGHRVAVSGDISKMFREILLDPEDQQYHRFWWRPTKEEPPRVYCMNRLTFGVTCSPFLAVKTLQQTAIDFGKAYPTAQLHIQRAFYVDDWLGGADTAQEAIKLQSQVAEVLSNGGFTLRKYRSNSQEVLRSIPPEMIEPMPAKQMVEADYSTYPKALGIVWDSLKDTMSVDVSPTGEFKGTKEGILSDTGKTFDVLGWLTPAVLPMKILFQELWKMGIGWEEELPQAVLQAHQTWRDELSSLSDVHVPRPYFLPEEALTVQLHGFSDASEKAFGAVIYVRTTYRHSNPTCILVTAKSKVAPLKQRTIPELELCC